MPARLARHRCALAVPLLVGLALLIAGCGSTGEDSTRAGEQAEVPNKGRGDDALRALRADANRILDGGPEAFEQRLTALRGHPVVVNQWASWCGPCRFEFPFFQDLAERYEGRVAFLGVDSMDSREEAEEFVVEFPVPYPHYFDPDAEIARVFRGGRAWPTTAYYNAAGELTQTHAGAYASEDDLDADVRRYALRG